MSIIIYTLHESPTLANQINRKLGEFDRNLKGRHNLFYCGDDVFLYLIGKNETLMLNFCLCHMIKLYRCQNHT